MKAQNLAIFDAKCELSPQVVPAIQNLGFQTICINPEEKYQDRGCAPSANVNVFECAIDAIQSEDRNIRSLFSLFISDITNIIAPPPNDKTSGGSAFFKNAGRDACNAVATYLILRQPETATPSHLYRVLSDQPEAKKALKRAANYQLGDDSDPIVNDMRRLASSVLEIIEVKPEYFPQLLKVPLDGLRCFDECGLLSNMGDFAVTRISDVRTSEKTVLINMTPLHLLERYKVFNSLVAYNIFAACMVYPNGVPLHAIFEEFNAIRIPDINKKLNTMRGLKFTCEIYVQSGFGIVNAYDELTAREIEVNCDVNHFMACNTLEEARMTSDMIGTRTIRTASANVSEDSFEKIGQSFQDKEVPILSPQEIMSMPPDDQIIKIRGMKPIYARKIKQWEIAGLRELLAENPLEGAAPNVPAKMGLKITKDGVTLKYPRKKRPNPFLPIWYKLRPILRPEYYIWLAAWVGIVAAYQIWHQSPELPALRYSTEYRGRSSADGYSNCHYITLLGKRYVSYVSDCPIITFRYLGV